MENIINKLNVLLADLNVYYRKLQNYHWNIEGKDFFIIHAKLEEYYDEVYEQIDEIAEQILTIGGQPLGRLKDYIEVSGMQEAENKKVKCEEVFENIIKDMNNLLKEVKDIKKEADEQNEFSTSAMMDNYISNYSKKLWMLNQMNK